MQKLLARLSTVLVVIAPLSCAEPPKIVADPTAQSYELELVAKGIDIPWAMVWLNESEMLVSDRKGELRLIKDGQLLEQKIEGVPEVRAQSQGGLLDLELDPNYAENGWIYMTYSGFEGEGSGANTSVMRAKLKDMQLVDKELLFEGSPNTTSGHHFGSRMAFDRAGDLYFSIGDRGNRDVNPQRLDRDAGKVHRIKPDGGIPDDNPFLNTENANKTVYSYGHRNPQGMVIHPKTGDIWTHEHGPRGGDEINIIKSGVNYGWPIVSYGINYSGTKFTDLTEKEGMQSPLWQWTPSIAPSDMIFVEGNKYPEWKDHLLVGSLKFQYLVLMKLDGDKVINQTKLFEYAGRMRSISQSPSGDIYIGTDGNGIFKVVKAKSE